MNAHTSVAAAASARIATPDELIELRLKLHANGYHPVPISGPHVATNSAGKRPTMQQWQSRCLTAGPKELARWSTSRREDTNTGILCGEIVGVDIDVLDPELSDNLVARALELLGPTPLIRTGRAPKTLLVYRAEAPHNKLATPELCFGSNVDDKEAKAKVEILARGQQFVGFGIHPDTNAPYRWSDRSPFDVPTSAIPAIKFDLLQQFVTEAEASIRAKGARATTEIKAEINEQEQQGYSAAGLHRGDKPSHEMVADALRWIPNNLDYEKWIDIGHSLYAALGDGGRDLWERWSSEYPDNKPEVTAAKWASFAGVRSITVGTLFGLAKSKGWRWRPRADRAAAGPGVSTAEIRSIIRIEGGNLPAIVDQAEQALIDSNCGIYQRGSMIVKPTRMPVKIADNKSTTAVRLAAVRAPLLVELMTSAATWLKYDGRSKEWAPIDCPERVANTLLAREQWGVPVLAGIVNCPVLRPDGSIIQDPGYDTASGLLYDPQGATFDRVPDNPTRDDALRSLAVLKDLTRTFPFVSDADRSVALSGILTAIHRRSLPTAPVHAFTAPGAGSGKSKLVDIASLIVDGREAAVMALGRTEDEAEKRFGAALLAGDAIVSIDNIDAERPFGGELFCQALTQGMLKIRVLGLSKLETIPTNAAIFANGNNLTLVGDMTRRAVMCTIDSGVERPELRVFDRDPLAMVRADRSKYVIAALTILRAFHVAGRPPQMGPDGKPVTPLGSFEEWSHFIRGALIWLGEVDPCSTMEKIRKKDPKLGAMVTVITQWLEVVGPEVKVTAKQLIEDATKKEGLFPNQEFSHPEFRDAFLIVAGDGGAVNSLKLGKWLAANQDRYVQGYKIVQDGERGGSKLWMLSPKGVASAPAPSTDPNPPKF